MSLSCNYPSFHVLFNFCPQNVSFNDKINNINISNNNISNNNINNNNNNNNDISNNINNDLNNNKNISRTENKTLTPEVDNINNNNNINNNDNNNINKNDNNSINNNINNNHNNNIKNNINSNDINNNITNPPRYVDLMGVHSNPPNHSRHTNNQYHSSKLMQNNTNTNKAQNNTNRAQNNTGTTTKLEQQIGNTPSVSFTDKINMQSEVSDKSIDGCNCDDNHKPINDDNCSNNNSNNYNSYISKNDNKQSSNSNSWLLKSLGGSGELIEGMLLKSTEADCMYPTIHYSLVHPSSSTSSTTPSLTKDSTFREMHTFISPTISLFPKRPCRSDTAFILSAFKSMGKEDVLEKKWTYWSGADYIFEHLPKHLTLHRITFHKAFHHTSNHGNSLDNQNYSHGNQYNKHKSNLKKEINIVTNNNKIAVATVEDGAGCNNNSNNNKVPYGDNSSNSFNLNNNQTTHNNNVAARQPHLLENRSAVASDTDVPERGGFTYVLLCEVVGVGRQFNRTRQFVESIKYRQCGFTSLYLPCAFA